MASRWWPRRRRPAAAQPDRIRRDQVRLKPGGIVTVPGPVQMHTGTRSPWRLAVMRDTRGQVLHVITDTRTYGTRQLGPTELDGLTELGTLDAVTVAALAVAARQHGMRLVLTVEPARGVT